MPEVIRNENRGEFYTPKHISELLHKMAGRYLGEDFKEKYIIWDNCWGTGNLTRNYEFNNLFCSTIQRMDIRKNKNRNREAKKFQYDFLNNDVEQLISEQAMWMGEQNLPEELDNILRNKDGGPILFYINPPYVATGIYGTSTDVREGQSDSRVREVMREHKMQSACDQVYAQFLYKINLMREAYDNKDISIAVICPPLFLTTQPYRNFRDRFLNNFKFNGGALFKASEFEGLSDRWGITIQVYTPGETVDKKNFKFDTYELKDGIMACTGEKVIYNLDNEKTCMDWAREELNSDCNVLADNTLSSGCEISNKKNVFWQDNSLGYMFYRGNNIYHNEQELGIMTLPYGDGSGYSLLDENFDKSMAIFCARRCFSRYGSNWINDKDEYCVPDTNSDAYKILLANSMIYTLFNGSMHASSLFINRDGNNFEVVNNFHHITLEETIDIFRKYDFEVSGPGDLKDRYMVDKIRWALSTGLIYKEGLQLLDIFRVLWEKGIKYRREFDKRYPKYQVCNWDCGFYQLKWLIKDVDINDFREFQLLYRSFEDRVRLLVHECGFLK